MPPPAPVLRGAQEVEHDMLYATWMTWMQAFCMAEGMVNGVWTCCMSVSADLSRKYPDMSSKVESKMVAMMNTWTEANTRVQQGEGAHVRPPVPTQPPQEDQVRGHSQLGGKVSPFTSQIQGRKAEVNSRNGEALQAVGSNRVIGGHGEAASIGEQIERTVELRDVSQSWEDTDQQLLHRVGGPTAYLSIKQE